MMFIGTFLTEAWHVKILTERIKFIGPHATRRDARVAALFTLKGFSQMSLWQLNLPQM